MIGMDQIDADTLSDQDVQGFFDRANSLDTLTATRRLYGDWAAVYDDTIERFGRYLSPDWFACEVARRCADRHVPVLDVACGTGLVGAALARHGFDRLTGLDLSPEMLDRAREKGCYRALIAGDVGGNWPVERGQFGVILCIGALTVGHMDVTVLRRMIEALGPGGLVLADIEASTFAGQGYAAVLEALRSEVGLAEVTVQDAHFYAPGPKEPFHGFYVVVRRG